MRGRKPNATAQRLLEGNPGKRPINLEEPQPPALADDIEETTPTELDNQPIAIAEWKRLAPMLRRCRQITEADRGSLVALCLEWARYITATREVAALGLVVRAPSGYPMQNPYLSIATKALAGCNKLWPELGLTPSSRSRVKAVGPGPDGDAFSEFDTPPMLPAAPTKH
jgi:P27 family predicted phage terminase small subunit